VTALPPVLDVGRSTARGTRARNEDSVDVLARGIAVIGDGVGGNPDGARASSLAVEAATRWLETGPGDPVAALMTVPLVAADALAVAEPSLHPRAATGLAAARVRGGIAYAMAVGDCRVSVFHADRPRDWRAMSSTADHDGLALAARDVAAALRLRRDPVTLSAEAAGEASRRLLGAIRAHTPREPQDAVLATPVRPGDLVLLTTDGVHDVLGTVGVCEVLAGLDDATVTAAGISDALVRGALDRGSDDNCSAAVIRLSRSG
jgi:protein phosphatase